MYTRAYPPRDTPLPQGYSGIALSHREEEETPPLHEETETVACQREAEPPAKEQGTGAVPNADLLLLATAALLLQGGGRDSELAVLLLLLLLWD